MIGHLIVRESLTRFSLGFRHDAKIVEERLQYRLRHPQLKDKHQAVDPNDQPGAERTVSSRDGIANWKAWEASTTGYWSGGIMERCSKTRHSTAPALELKQPNCPLSGLRSFYAADAVLRSASPPPLMVNFRPVARSWSTSTVCPSLISPLSNSRPRAVSSSFWITRFKGRAP